MPRNLRKTIEYQPEDLYFKFLFHDKEERAHFAIYRLEDMKTPIGTCTRFATHSKTLNCSWQI